MKFSTVIALFAVTALAVYHRPLKIVAYPYIPDLNEDQLVGLADFLQDRFNADTGRSIQILFDLDTYATDTYTPSNVVTALSPATPTAGGFDMQEIDTIILGYLLQHNTIQRIPDSVSYEGFGANVLKAVKDQNGVAYGHPSYTCTNLYYSYDSSINSNSNGNQFISWMNSHRAAGQLGWTGDLSSEPDLRLEYLDGWKDSHPTTAWYPSGYDYHTSQIDNAVVSNIIALRNSCAKDHNNDCVDGDFYNDAEAWFTKFVNGGSLVVQGFPEYTSEILKIANTDVMNPTKIHNVSPALVGNGNKPFLFTDAWVISRTNCDADCLTTAKIFLNWQRKNWATLISLGKDLSPQRPRFLAVAYQPFYSSEDVTCDLPDFAQDYYAFFNHEINRAVALDTVRFWDNEDTQSATLEGLITVGYHP